MADAARTATLAHFRAARLVADNKAGEAGFDPVTIADREAEEAMRAILAAERPDDGIHGEEHGKQAGTSGLTWVLDPIDGTRAFISGLPTWGVLIGLDDGNEGRIGVVDQPFTGERFIGVNDGAASGAFLERHGSRTPLKVRACPALAQATLMTTDPHMFAGAEAEAFHAVRGEAMLTRYGVDCYAYAMLASGQIDLVIETQLQAYDISGPAALVRAAGGVVTDWRGGDCRWGGQTIAAGDPAVHEAALRILSPAAA
ncbi:histidinol-phosphatase [Rhodobacteraceae bacterium NNCM2]|nr:histidinol-phosphatase [Coraliihabitans acroporae]